FDSDRNLVSEENSAPVPTASISTGELGGSITRELGGPSTADGGEINYFDVDEALQERTGIGPRRTRFIWTPECHQIFVEAVNTLTLQRAVPRKILEYMRNCGVQNITRAIVASHLQKYRLGLKKGHVEVDKASKVPFRTISFNATSGRNQEENMRNQDENMRYQDQGNMRYQEGNMRYQEVNMTNHQGLQENLLNYEMTNQRWPLFEESLPRPGLTQPHMFSPPYLYKNEPTHLQNLPNQFPGYVDANNNNNVIASPNQFARYADGNNNNNVLASLINDGLSNHVPDNDRSHYHKVLRELIAYQEYNDDDDDIMNIKPEV
uniref:Uncharacterized protein n=1 Tax=Cucumis melo TaxID=3656 RepID=A0A9I9DAX2_CUCME